MKTCKDCYHYDVCGKKPPEDTPFSAEQYCPNVFKDRSLILDLPCKPIGVMSDGNEFNTDVYCSYCGTNLSGLYGDEPTEIIQCYNCGKFLDNTKIITKEAAGHALKELNNEQ